MRRFLTLFLVLILIFSLCACNNSQLLNNDEQKIQGTDDQQPQDNDTPSNTKYKLTVIDNWNYLVSPLDEYYDAGEEVDVTLAFLSGPSVGIELNGEYIDQSSATKHDGARPIITFIMPAKDSVLYTTQNGQISPKNEISDAEPNQWGVVLEVANVTSTGLTLICKHSGGENVAELDTGSFYVIQKHENAGWVDVEYLPQEYDITWTAEAWIIQKEGTTCWDVNWEHLYGELSAGKYRIGKEIMNFRGTGDYDTELVYAEFMVSQGSETFGDDDAVEMPTGDIDGDVSKSNLTMRTLKALVERYGEDLTWDVFEDYYSEKLITGLHSLRYPIDEDYYLVLAGSIEEKPTYIHLVSEHDHEKYIDIRTGDIDDFLNSSD